MIWEDNIHMLSLAKDPLSICFIFKAIFFTQYIKPFLQIQAVNLKLLYDYTMKNWLLGLFFFIYQSKPTKID